MSRIHIIFSKKENKNKFVCYAVESQDFGAETIIGELLIEPNTGEYRFIPMGMFDKKVIIPPQLFNLPDNERNRCIESDYPNFEYAGYSSRIAKMVDKMIENEEYPNKFYGVI